jgi:very-short-patch-repair endonuclease
LSNKKIYSFDFHRQKPLLNYIVDFYCYELDLVIEVDGIYHFNDEKSLMDNDRDKALSEYGLTVLRFTEHEVKKDMINVLGAIDAHIAKYIGEENL